MPQPLVNLPAADGFANPSPDGVRIMIGGGLEWPPARPAPPKIRNTNTTSKKGNRVANPRPRRTSMHYTDKDGNRQNLYETGAKRLAYVTQRGSVSSAQTPPGEHWKPREVSALEDRGLWEVDWVVPGDIHREHSFNIVTLTPLGRQVLADWNRLVEEGGALRGTPRTHR